MTVVIQYFDGISDEMKQLCKKYWAMRKDSINYKQTVSSIAEEYNLYDQNVAKVVRKYCIAKSTDLVCCECELTYRIFKSRSDYADRNVEWICDECRKILNEEKRQSQIIKQQKIIEQQQNENDEKFNVLTTRIDEAIEDGLDIQTFSFDQAINLLSVLRLCGSEK